MVFCVVDDAELARGYAMNGALRMNGKHAIFERLHFYMEIV